MRKIKRNLATILCFILLLNLNVSRVFAAEEECEVKDLESGYPSAFETPVPTDNQRESIVAMAASQVGYQSTSENVTAYGAWYGMQSQWCAMFISWCANKAGIPTSIVPKAASANYGFKTFYSKMGRYYIVSGGYCTKGRCNCSKYSAGTISINDIKAGDILLVDTDHRCVDSDTNTGESNLDNADHVALVEKVESGIIYTIEGNTTGDKVARKTRSVSEIHGVCRPNYVEYNDPIGCLDIVRGGEGNISVGGWAFDWDDVSKSLEIHVYVGGEAGSGAPGYVITANGNGEDVNKAYPGAGNYHRFANTITVSKRGEQTIYVYAINVGGGKNVLIGSETVNISTPFSITMSPENVNMNAGDSKNVEITFTGDGIYTLNCKNSDTSVCSTKWGSVDYGTGKTSIMVTAKKAGTATISIELLNSDMNVLYTKDFTVTAGVKKGTLTVQPSDLTLNLYSQPSSLVNLSWDECYGASQIFVDSSNRGIVSYQSETMGTSSASIKITAQKEGSTLVIFGVKDSSGNILAQNTVNVTVISPSYTVSYDANGGSNAPANQTKKYNTTLVLSSKLPERSVTLHFEGNTANGVKHQLSDSKLQYTFLGWNTKQNGLGMNFSSGASYGSNANLTLYAQWQVPKATGIDSIFSGDSCFKGWYTSASGGTRVTSNTAISQNMTVYAQWNQEDNGHDSYGNWIIQKNATCTNEGIRYRVCGICGHKMTEKIPAIGHNIVIDPAVPATLSTPGKTEGSHCSVCGTIIKQQQIIDNNVEKFVARLYSLVLGREADNGGLSAWASALREHQSSGVDTGYGFVFSTECMSRNLSNDDFVEMLYNTFMNRPSDDGGKSAWIAQLNAGVDRELILYGFIMSEEFTDICRQYGINVGNVSQVTAFSDVLGYYRNQNAEVTKFVSRCYTEALNRGYDTAGLEGWCKVILTGSNTPKEVAQNFIFSDEFVGKRLNNVEYVKVLYRTFMGREADEAGLSAWVHNLDMGKEDRSQVLEGFANSPEFAEILAGFGLQ